MRTAIACALLAAAGCGDNVPACGSGTVLMGNVCEPTSMCGTGTMLGSGGTCIPLCTNGLVLDPVSGMCVLGPGACPPPYAVVGGVCQNPDQSLTVDVDEGPEPNGLGVLGERSASPAGTVALKPVGIHAVIHGHIIPFEDSDGDGQYDPDIDSYLVTVAAPTLLSIKADGFGGLDAGFLAVAQVAASDPLASWRRIGANLVDATSQRQILLPTSGTYIIAIADTRTLLAGATAGNTAAEYWVTIDALDLPTPAALVLASGVATANDATAGEVHFYSASGLGLGLDDVNVTSSRGGVQMMPALDVYQNSSFRVQAAGSVAFGPFTTDAFVGNFAAADTALVAVDPVYDYAPMPAPFALTITSKDATPLCSPDPTQCASSTATETAIATAPPTLFATNQFYFDASAANTVEGLALAWNHPVQGSVYDQNGELAATFTLYTPTSATWQSYTGLVRVRTAGRYYVAVFDPTATAGTTGLTATTTLAPQTVAAIAEGAPVTVAASSFASSFTYATGTDPWHLFDTTGTNTGGQHVEWYDASSSFGRLDALATSTGTVTVAPIFAHDFATTGASSDAGCTSAGCGRIVLDDGTTKYFVKANAASPTAGAQLALAFGKRTIVDFGSIASGGSAASTNQLASPGYFLFRTPNGNRATITMSPHTAGAGSFQRVDHGETAQAASVSATFAAPGVDGYTENNNGWTAFVVTDTTTTVPYDVSAAVQ